jgi:Chromate transport protein ChrA
MDLQEHYSYWKRLWLLFFTFAKIAALVVGGGYAILPVVEETFTRKSKLISSEELLDMMALVQTIPGIIAANSAVYVGMKVAGFGGVLAAVSASAFPRSP